MEIRVTAGTRIGWWNPVGGHFKNAFEPMGFYVGPDLDDPHIGKQYEQNLMEGTVKFRVGILFRPDRNSRQRLETILILEKALPEMWDYDTWTQEMESA